jgi:NADH-quinone oxidoreductase subunit C
VTPERAVALIQERFGLEPAAAGRALTVAGVPLDRWRDLLAFAKETLGCRLFGFLTAVDWKGEGLEVVCRVENPETGLVLTAKTRLGPEARCPSLTGVYRGADWMERECYDMFGARFDGHPDLRRILLSEEWEGYPLRKDYPADAPHSPYR